MKWSKRRSFGQHILKDPKILAKIIEAAQIKKTEIVCEAGTGTGVLTNELCKYARTVISFEVDDILFEKTKKLLSSFSNLKLMNLDLFKLYSIPFDVFVSNLPYSRSKEAFQWLSLQKFNRAIIMIQKEFADKLQSSPGQENYRAITVIIQHCFTIKSLFTVHNKSFDPEPVVTSTVIQLIPKHTTITYNTIRNLNIIFSQRNKKASVVAKKFGITLPSCNMRIDELKVEELIKLSSSKIEEMI
jgi:16S rRNA A1518/A1519 N6-dimethyltransferase RsmA/KsgA/DIM1 with predicted DNA glycosylase/AP lyase activity